MTAHFNKYYQDELAFLREMGKEFAQANPSAAVYLAERGSDPDVERLLEGFAFLAGRLRQKLDDELPELSQSLMQMLWPHYLRPLPAMAILEFEPIAGVLREPQTVPRGTELDSLPVDGTACRFRTCYDVLLLPIVVEGAEFERPAGATGQLRVRFRVVGGAQLPKLGVSRLRLFLHGDTVATSALYLHLTRRLREIHVGPAGAPPAAPGRFTLAPEAVNGTGFEDDQAILPWPPHAFPAYRYLQEYFALPQKYLFLDVKGLERLAGLGAVETFELLFLFATPPDASFRVATDALRLHCTPIANLFPAQSDPIRVDHSRVEYLVRPGMPQPRHHQIFSIDRVKGWVRGTAQPRDYPSFLTFRHLPEQPGRPGTSYYQTRLKSSVIDRGVDTFISFVTARGESAVPMTETVVCELTCCNRGLTEKLRVGDVNKSTGNSPEFAKFRNITPVTPTIVPPLEGDLHWRLISNMSLNNLSLARVETLRGLLGVYNFKALYDRQASRENELRLDGILDVKTFPEERLYNGAPIRGARIEMTLQEEDFAGEGEMVLFAEVLNEFLALYCTLNAYTRLVVRGATHGGEYEWKPKLGQMNLI